MARKYIPPPQPEPRREVASMRPRLGWRGMAPLSLHFLRLYHASMSRAWDGAEISVRCFNRGTTDRASMRPRLGWRGNPQIDDEVLSKLSLQ